MLKTRRRLLLGMLTTPLMLLGGCTPNARARELVSATFLQLWPAHAGLTVAEWDRRFGLLHELGYGEIILQWTAKEGGRDNWRFPDAALTTLFDVAERRHFGVQVGLPHDDRWISALSSSDTGYVTEFFGSTTQRIYSFLKASVWNTRAAFRGWYIPYEIEQHSWADSGRRAQLIGWLAELAAMLEENSGTKPTISTYFSQLSSSLTLESLWVEILKTARLRPMIQDGVGVAGLGNYKNLEPLRKLFLNRKLKWDLIIELFEELPSAKSDGTTFEAHSATFARIQKQLNIAENYGADSVVAFAAEPWLIGSTPQAEALLHQWRKS